MLPRPQVFLSPSQSRQLTNRPALKTLKPGQLEEGVLAFSLGALCNPWCSQCLFHFGEFTPPSTSSVEWLSRHPLQNIRLLLVGTSDPVARDVIRLYDQTPGALSLWVLLARGMFECYVTCSTRLRWIGVVSMLQVDNGTVGLG